MRIGMILDAPFPPDVRVEKEAIALIGAGHELFLFCLDYEGKPQNEVYKGINLRRYHASNLDYKLSALAYTVPLYSWSMRRKIRKFIGDCNPEIIHVHDMVIAEAGFREARAAGLNVVLDLHENRPAIMREYPHLKKFPGKILIDLEVWKRKQLELVNSAYKCVVVTDLAKQNLLDETSKRSEDIVVLPNTPSIAFSNLPLDDNIIVRMESTFNLLYVGDTGERRGTADLIQAVAKLSTEIPELRLWIVGKSSFDGRLKALTEQLHVKDKILFEGWQSESLFPSYITGAHICLSPLRRNIHHDSTFANKVFQYMAMGKASVVSDSTAQADLIKSEECGLTHLASNVEDLAAKIMILYRDEDLRERMGRKAREAVSRKWNWEISSSALIEMYTNLAKVSQP